MSINESPYWADVREEIAVIDKTIGGSAFQRRDAVYIISVFKRGTDPAFRAGVVSIAPIRLAAQRIVDGVARIATDDEIRAYVEEEAKKKKEIVGTRAAGTMIFAPEPRPVEIPK